VDLYIHSPIRLHGVVLNSLSTGTTLPFTRFETSLSSPPATRRATVEVFDPASTRACTLLRASYLTTDGQLASLSWSKAPIWGLRPDLYYLWGALSDERTGLSFIYAAGPCQRNFSRVQVPWDSRPYFTVSELRLPFSSPPTTRRVTVEVFHPASKRGLHTSESESYVTTDGQPASLAWNKAPIWGLRPDLYYLCDSYGLVLVGRPL
jgi:hypothetical protein